MPKALELLSKAARPRHVERRIGKKKGDVLTRTVVGGRSYDHVRTGSDGLTELHPTNVDNALGTIRESGGTFEARSKGRNLGRHAHWHKAARAIISHARGGRAEDGESSDAQSAIEDSSSPTGMADLL